MLRNEKFLKTAEELRPELRTCHIEVGAGAVLGKGDSVRLDLGRHITGYASFKLGYKGSHPDAPVLLRIRFAEIPSEFDEDLAGYNGWVCGGWVQEERIHVDVLPCELKLPRRYAFRYIELEVLEISSKFSLVAEAADCTAVSSAGPDLEAPAFKDPELEKIDQIGVNTLRDCMQLVFEDGPKRDRRLWLGDLRLQAMADYCSFKNYSLVKRCLYLFAGSTFDGGRIAAGLFIEPEVEADDVAMFDYSLLFIPTLLDYYEATGDMDTLKQLWPSAKRQIELSAPYFDEDGLVKDMDAMGWCFTDWNLALNKQASAQGVYIYALKEALKICRLLGDDALAENYESDIKTKSEAAVRKLYDSKTGLFTSGNDRQISWASQVWMTLAGVDKDGSSLERIESADAVKMVTPYMYHHYVQALIDTGRKEKALDVIKCYWGGMAKAGADTFWEMYDPEDPGRSPYGGTIVNSYCHAWSCGPVYFLRKYFKNC